MPYKENIQSAKPWFDSTKLQLPTFGATSGARNIFQEAIKRVTGNFLGQRLNLNIKVD